MKFYALLDYAHLGIKTGRVKEVIPEIFNFEGVDYPLEERYHPTFISRLIECPEGAVENWTFDGEIWRDQQGDEV